MANEKRNLRISFLVVLMATAGSLFFSEVMKLPPCVLCWYQRISIYPLVILFGVALWTEARDYGKYALPLILIGTAFSVYHNLLYYGIIPESISPCVQGISCTSRQIEWFGFLTIPLMALISFGFLLLLNLPGVWRRTEDL